MGRRNDGQTARGDGTAPLIARLGHPPPLSNPEAAWARVDEIADALPSALREGAARDLLAALADHSTFLWSLASRDPARLARLFEEAPEAADARIVAAQRAAGRPGEDAAPDLDAVGRTLRRNRAEHALLVALADIGGIWPLERVTAALSDFADASVAAAVDAMLLQAAASGRFLPKDRSAPQAGSGLVVLGLGKLGGRELNYSSDIDLIVFFDPGATPLKEGLSRRRSSRGWLRASPSCCRSAPATATFTVSITACVPIPARRPPP